MFRLYPLVIVLQGFCLYHAYSNKSEQKWFWIIIFFPFIGSLIYLYVHFYSRRNLDLVQEEVKNTFIKNHKINKLEREVKFSDTFTNKMELADEHSRLGNYERALELYLSCKEGMYADDPELITKLIRVYYLNEDYHQVIIYGKELQDNKDFKTSKEKSALGWSYHKLGDAMKAREVFEETDIEFSNYINRIEYAKFLFEIDDEVSAQDLLERMLEEIAGMDSVERRSNRHEIREIKQLHRHLHKS